LLARAEAGDIDDASFVTCIRTSLPYAYTLVQGLAADLTAKRGPADQPFVDNRIEPPTEQARGELLRAVASDAIRAALERHFDVRIAFQNCHRVAIFPTGQIAEDARVRFTSPRAQLLNQNPELVNC